MQSKGARYFNLAVRSCFAGDQSPSMSIQGLSSEPLWAGSYIQSLPEEESNFIMELSSLMMSLYLLGKKRASQVYRETYCYAQHEACHYDENDYADRQVTFGHSLASSANKNGSPKGIRTPVAGLRTRSPRPLDDGATQNVGWGRWTRTTTT